jgi:hypothetical protein
VACTKHEAETNGLWGPIHSVFSRTDRADSSAKKILPGNAA